MTSALLDNVTNIMLIPTEAGGVTQFINQTTTAAIAAAAGKSGQITNFTIPVDMVFGQANIMSITAYCILFVVGLFSNTMSLYHLIRSRYIEKNMSRMVVLLLHLTFADLSVILIGIPLEIGWAYTVSWEADELTCRAMVFLKIFGYFLSSYILIVISIDRFSAIVFPLYHLTAMRKTKNMLVGCWIVAFCCSVPQFFIFTVRTHPVVKDYKQCMRRQETLEGSQEVIYFGYFFVLSWVLPVLVMGFCYSAIVVSIFKSDNKLLRRTQGRNSNSDQSPELPGSRQPTKSLISKAKIKSVKVTGVLIIGFILTWTPYQIASLWYYIDKDSFFKLDFRVQKMLWVFCCVNNCVNPFLYNMFEYKSGTSCRKQFSNLLAVPKGAEFTNHVSQESEKKSYIRSPMNGEPRISRYNNVTKISFTHRETKI